MDLQRSWQDRGLAMYPTWCLSTTCHLFLSNWQEHLLVLSKICQIQECLALLHSLHSWRSLRHVLHFHRTLQILHSLHSCAPRLPRVLVAHRSQTCVSVAEGDKHTW